jgi:hypothetical protein
MFTCPHCHKPIEVGPQPDIPWWKYDPGNPKVSLGCGTLLAIGVIVALCSGGLSRSQFNDLRGDLRRLENKVESVDASLKQLAPPEKAGVQAAP